MHSIRTERNAASLIRVAVALLAFGGAGGIRFALAQLPGAFTRRAT